MKKQKKGKSKLKKYLVKTAAGFFNSFAKLDRTILYIVVYKLVFYLGLLGCYKVSSMVFFQKSMPLFKLAASDASVQTKEVLQTYIQAIHTFYIEMALYAALFAIIIFAIYSLTNLLIWSAITGKKLKKKDMKFSAGFFGLSAVWVLTWVMIMLLAVLSVRTEVVALWIVPITLFYGHFTNLAYISYFKRGKVFKSIRSSFGVGTSKLGAFILPYILTLVGFIIINLVLMLIPIFIKIRPMTLYFIVFLFYFAWFRIYVYSFAKKLL